MKQTFKRFISVLLVCTMAILVLPISAFADDSIDSDAAHITRIVLVEDGVARDISYEEYMELTADNAQPVVYIPSQTDNQTVSINPMQSEFIPVLPLDYTVGYHYNFVPTSTTSGLLSAVRVSHIFQNASSISVTSTVTKERTITHSGGLTLTAEIKNTIFSGIEGFYGYSDSATSSTAVSITGEFTPSGDCTYSAVFFRPRVRTVTGTLNYYMAYMGETTLLNSTSGIKAQYPHTLSSGVLDGAYLLYESDVLSDLE